MNEATKQGGNMTEKDIVISELRSLYDEHGYVDQDLATSTGVYYMARRVFGKFSVAKAAAGIKWNSCKRYRHNKTNRICLKCDKPFPSYGPQNRICQKCKENHERFGVIDMVYLGSLIR